MLVLTRKANEGVVIGENIKVKVLSVDGEKVRLGIEAPVSMRIFREELIRETGEENKNAVNSSLVTFDIHD